MSSALSDMSDNFPIHEGALLASCYEVQDFLGEGSFGKVAKCAHIVTDTKVAIKITKDNPIFTERALEEIKILKQLQTLDPDECNLVKWNGAFFHERFICLEFELLDLSLHEYMQLRHNQFLYMAEICPVIHQLTTALFHLEALGIIHADLKPENIMVVDRWQQPLQVKLIDFGLARHVSDVLPGSCVQSLWYRAPEVMLGLDFMEPIDMWSLGLVAAELALGHPLFPGEQEYDIMKFIVDTLGQPPDYLLNCGQKSTRFFHIQGSYNQQTWRLKSPQEFAGQTGHHFRDTRYCPFSSLEALEEMMLFRAEENELRTFVDLLKKMLQVDKNKRITPLKVLEHPFFSVEWHTDSSQNRNITILADVNEADVNEADGNEADGNEADGNEADGNEADGNEADGYEADVNEADGNEADVNEAEPNATHQPSSEKNSVQGFGFCNAAFKATTPQEETLFTPPENVSAKLEDEEDEAAQIQLEVVVETSSKRAGCIKRFFKTIRNAFSCCFCGGN